jgi:Fe-S cluster assembly protein SufD
MVPNMTEATVKFTRTQRTSREISKEIGFIPDFSASNELVEYRKAAWSQWQSLPFPNEKDEDWSRTSVQNLNLEGYKEASVISYKDSQIPQHLNRSLTEKNQGGRVFISGSKTDIFLAKEIQEQGVVFTDFLTAMDNHPGLLRKLLEKSAKSNEYKFAELTAAISTNGILLYVPRNVKVEKPLQSITWLSGEGILQTSHIVVFLEESAEVTYVHETSSPEKLEAQSLHTGLFEISVGPEAKLNFVELQSLGVNVWNISHETVTLDNDSHVDWIFGALGSKITKNFSHLNLAGRGATGKMSGFYFTNGSQHLDHDTQQNHLAPNTTSDLLFKGALLGESRSIWQGMIYVDPKASKTDGYQANRNLVLSQKARADSIPGLEILTDDVRCTHGATVGKIDQELVFYLQSRGLPKKEAEKLIVEGFFDPIMQRIPFDNVRQRFQNAIEEKMSSY